MTEHNPPSGIHIESSTPADVRKLILSRKVNEATLLIIQLQFEFWGL